MASWILRNLVPGFRFCPSDTESVSYYLAIKNKDRIDFSPDHDIDFIPEYDINRITPEQLPQNCPTTGKKGEQYIFAPRDPSKSRQSRIGENHSWIPKNSTLIKRDGRVIGLKTTLELHAGRGRGRGNKTVWLMYEYSQATPKTNEYEAKKAKHVKKVGEFVLCKIFKNLKKDAEGNDTLKEMPGTGSSTLAAARGGKTEEDVALQMVEEYGLCHMEMNPSYGFSDDI